MVNFEAEVADLAGVKEENQDRLIASVVRCKCLGFLLAVLVFRVDDLLLRETRGEVRTAAGSSLYRICSLFFVALNGSMLRLFGVTRWQHEVNQWRSFESNRDHVEGELFDAAVRRCDAMVF